MRILFCLLLSVFLLVEGTAVHADTIYNTNSYSRDDSSTIYNSRGSGASSGGPIMLKNMLRAPKENTTLGRSNASYRPYNTGSRGNGYALSMTPDQVRAKHAQDLVRAKQRAKAERKRQTEKEAGRAARSSQVEQETEAYTRRFQGGDNIETAPTPVYSKKRRRSVYVEDKDGLTTPQKVFNSIY